MATKSKAEFVRSLPPEMSAKDVIAKAQAAGFKLSPAYVYVIRSKSGSKNSGKGRPKGRGRAAGSEKQFVTLALELGFGRAQQLLDDTRARVRAAVG